MRCIMTDSILLIEWVHFASRTFAVIITVSAPAQWGTARALLVRICSWVALAWSPILKRVIRPTSPVWSQVCNMNLLHLRQLEDGGIGICLPGCLKSMHPEHLQWASLFPHQPPEEQQGPFSFALAVGSHSPGLPSLRGFWDPHFPSVLQSEICKIISSS